MPVLTNTIRKIEMGSPKLRFCIKPGFFQILVDPQSKMGEINHLEISFKLFGKFWETFIFSPNKISKTARLI